MDHPLAAADLTDILRRGGSPTPGEIVHVEHDRTLRTWVSALDFVRVEYSADAARDLPRALVVKRPRPDPPDAVTYSHSELDFYRRVAAGSGSPPLVRCVAALEDSPPGPVLLLEDLRQSHDHAPWPVPPPECQSEAAVEALATIHARWWEHAALGHGVGTAHTEHSLRAMVRGVSNHLPAFLGEYGNSLPRGATAILERVFGSELRPWLRLTESRALTVAHGDAHSWNFLFPRSGEGPAYLIDWQLWHIDVGARDLAFLMALHWSPMRRHELERHLLHRYHDRLAQLGVAGYSMDDLVLDYRRCVVRNLTIPIIFWRRGMAPEGWWHRLDYALSAYREWAADELL
jgi:hypothetical protein